MKFATILCALCLVIAACTSTTEPPQAPIGPPTSIMIQNVDTTSIQVTWSRTKDDTKPDTVVITSLGISVKTQAANAPDSSAIIRGLSPGIAYTVSVHSANTSSGNIPWIIPGAATNIMIQTVDTSGIIVRWSRMDGDAKTDTVVVTSQGIPVKVQPVNAPDSVAVILGLNAGTEYMVSVHSANAVSASVSWTIPIPQKPTFASPHVGSSFQYIDWSTDSVGRRAVVDSFGYTVVASDMVYQGKDHVTQFNFVSAFGTQSFFVNYEANGDIEVFETFGSGSGKWAAIPISSKGEVSTVVQDTIENGTSYLTTETYRYDGTEDLTVGTLTFKNAIRIASHVVRLSNGTETDPNPGNMIWFSPDLGWFVKVLTPAYRSSSGEMNPQYDQNLVRYLLR